MPHIRHRGHGRADLGVHDRREGREEPMKRDQRQFDVVFAEQGVDGR